MWQCVKTLYPFCSHQNSWDLWMFIPLKMVLIGIDPYPCNVYTYTFLAITMVFLNCIGQGLTVKRLNRILYYNLQK
jgi:hypothetical protein